MKESTQFKFPREILTSLGESELDFYNEIKLIAAREFFENRLTLKECAQLADITVEDFTLKLGINQETILDEKYKSLLEERANEIESGTSKTISLKNVIDEYQKDLFS